MVLDSQDVQRRLDILACVLSLAGVSFFFIYEHEYEVYYEVLSKRRGYDSKKRRSPASSLSIFCWIDIARETDILTLVVDVWSTCHIVSSFRFPSEISCMSVVLQEYRGIR